MEKIIEEFRLRFEAETDIEKLKTIHDWKRYASWLEVLAYKKINSELVKENYKLRQAFYDVIDILDINLTSRS